MYQPFCPVNCKWITLIDTEDDHLTLFSRVQYSFFFLRCLNTAPAHQHATWVAVHLALIMNKWMSEWTKTWMNEWMNEWVPGRSHKNGSGKAREVRNRNEEIIHFAWWTGIPTDSMNSNGFAINTVFINTHYRLILTQSSQKSRSFAFVVCSWVSH